MDLTLFGREHERSSLQGAASTARVSISAREHSFCAHERPCCELADRVLAAPTTIFRNIVTQSLHVRCCTLAP
jgi:hypothetical protein